MKHGSTELSNCIKQINHIRSNAKEGSLNEMEGSNDKTSKNEMYDLKIVGKESSNTSINISKRQEQSMQQFNDYDCSDFQNLGTKKDKQKLRLSKNLM